MRRLGTAILMGLAAVLGTFLICWSFRIWFSLLALCFILLAMLLSKAVCPLLSAMLPFFEQEPEQWIQGLDKFGSWLVHDALAALTNWWLPSFYWFVPLLFGAAFLLTLCTRRAPAVK